ncbi:MAG: hypothetical protein ACI9YT_002215 [Halobacteriales archaeon]|jgi:hypothetical protein
MSLRRRAFLLGSSGTVASLAGCADVFSTSTPTVDLNLPNYTAEPQPLKLELLRTDRDDHGDALAFAREFELPAPPEDEPAGVVREPDVVQHRRYLVTVLPKFGRGQWHHHHFYPGEDATAEGIFVGLYRDDETETLCVRFLLSARFAPEQRRGRTDHGQRIYVGLR